MCVIFFIIFHGLVCFGRTCRLFNFLGTDPIIQITIITDQKTKLSIQNIQKKYKNLNSSIEKKTNQFGFGNSCHQWFLIDLSFVSTVSVIYFKI
jgi:hypothetical protein